MVTEEKTPTVEELNASIERLTTGDLVQAENALADAKSNFGKVQKSASVDELLALAELVKSAQTAVERVNANIAVAKRRIATLEWESKSAELRTAGTLIAQSVRDALSAAADVLQRFNVTGYVVSVTGIGTPEMAINVKPMGPDIPKAPTGAKRASTGGAGGPRGRVVYKTPNGPLGSREMLEQFGASSPFSERVAKMLADPDAGRKGLSHLARQVAEKLGFESVLAAS